MQNDPELSGKGKYLGKISSDFALVADLLKESSYQIRKRGFSDYPIFPVSMQEIPVGQILIEQGKLGNSWNYYASFLDEFVQRELVDREKEQEFIKSYKDADEFCCLFVIDGDFTNFVFIPYPED